MRMIVEMGGKWPYSCCFVGCCFQNLFKIARSILMKFPSSFFAMCLVSAHVVHPYSSLDTATAWKKCHFILSDWSDFQMTNNLSIAACIFARHILTSLSVDETLLLRYMNLWTNFTCIPLRMKMAPYCLKHLCFVLWVFMWRPMPPAYSRLDSWGFSLGRCICKKHYIICIVCVSYSFYRILSADCFFLV